MLSIVLIGTGNVASHLFHAFRKRDELQIIQVAGRSLQALEQFGKWTKISSGFTNLDLADIYIIALSDNAIATVSKEINVENKLVVHTSGSVEMTSLSEKNRTGVFYPLQTFSRERKVNFKTVPICIEAGQREDLAMLERLASTLTDKVYKISSEERKALHLAAVFANNFTNHMYAIANDICLENGLPFEILYPLIEETGKKVTSLAAYDAQTGPARRNDQETIKRHLGLLKDPLRKEIYSILSKSIGETYEQKL
jgi:predicted short-subunit dehydrogenase-like oxidoreductase (DUF2520 family)